MPVFGTTPSRCELGTPKLGYLDWPIKRKKTAPAGCLSLLCLVFKLLGGGLVMDRWFFGRRGCRLQQFSFFHHHHKRIRRVRSRFALEVEGGRVLGNHFNGDGFFELQREVSFLGVDIVGAASNLEFGRGGAKDRSI